MICVNSVNVSPKEISLKVGNWSYAAKADVCPANADCKGVTWHSSNSCVASVNASNGYIYANAVGTAKIYATATDGSGCYDSLTVTVSSVVPISPVTPVSSVCICPETETLITGKTMFLCATVYPENATNKCLYWSSSNPTVATVNPISGLVYAQKAGTTMIRATAQDGSCKEDFCCLTVTDPIPVEAVTLDMEKIHTCKGNSHQLHATVMPTNATEKAICWQSSNNAVATVTSYGRVTAKSGGRAFIYARATDGSGALACCEITVEQTVCCCAEETPVNKVHGSTFADPVDVCTGAHMLSNTIMSLFGGQGLRLVAHYDSTQLASGMLGSGWYHNFEKHIEVDGNMAFVFNNPSVFALYEAKSDCCNSFLCRSTNKNGYVLTVDHCRQYPYIINCNGTKTEYYNSSGDLAKIVDYQGFETLIAYSNNLITITDGVSGKKMHLEKDGCCKVIRVYDEDGRSATLSYSGTLLTEICDVNGNMLRYTYDEKGRVKTGIDAKDICYFENTYDEFGRIASQKDAIESSLKSTFVYDENKRITTNRNGKQSIRVYNDKGLLVSFTDENGNATTYEYDERNNVIKETDARGNSVIKSYNCFNKPTEITDKNGNKTTLTYDSKGNVVKIRYPAVGGVIPEETFVYNSRNQLTGHTDLRGTVTLYTYDANGMLASKKVGTRNAILYSYQDGLLKSQTDAKGNTTTYTYNAIGQMVSKTDADNKVTQYVYDAVGNLLQTVDANGKAVVNTYDGNRQKTSVTDANGNKTQYSYNGNQKNDVITLPDGNTIRYEFDGENRPVKITDQANNVTQITYDMQGRVTAKHFPDGATVQYTYDAVGNVVKETNPKGAVVTKTYDANGNVLTVTDDEGNTTTYEYNAMSKVTKVINAVAGTTVYTYSAAGDLLSETDALGNTRSYTYDAFGNRLTATDAKGNVTTYTYDANNNLLTVKNALNQVTTYTYNALNQCVSVKDPLNNIIRYGYDALGRRTTVTDARGNVFTTTSDGNGNVVKTTDAKGNTVSQTVYNCLNHPVSVTDAMGKTTTYTYNAMGKVECVKDCLNHPTTFTYDSRGRNIAVRDLVNNTSTAEYDLLGNVTRLAGPLGGATTYTYDDMGRLTAESTVSGGTKRYEYNALNVRSKVTNARNQVRQLFYDAMGRITGYTSPEGTVSYTYDANGNVLTVTDSHGTINRTYDALNRVASYTDTYGKVIRYQYDAAGNLTRLVYPDNTAVNYSYDANHNLIRVTDWANRVTTYTYDVNNRVIGVTKPDGSVTTTVYDNMQRVTSTVEKTASGAVISGFNYTYDNLSRVVEETVLANSTKLCYTYDALSRVTKRKVKNLCDEVLCEETFSYDAAGNVTDAPDSCFQYDIHNRLTVFNGEAVTYDLDGNMLSNGESTFTYDSANRLITAGGHTYTYNAEDVRIRNLCTEEDTTYTYDTNCRLSKLLTKTTNGAVTKYVYGRGLIGEETGNAFKTYHFDFRGSTVAITDGCGNITDTFAYDTYGKCICRTGTSDVIFGYNGKDGVVTDKNGLIYMRARYYSPEMKRFINADVIAGDISNAITLNRFAYANGNPVSLTDPFGLYAAVSGPGANINDQFSYSMGDIGSTDDMLGLSPDTRGETTGDEIEYGSDEYLNILCKLITEGTNIYSHTKDTEELIKAVKLIHGKVQFVHKGDYIIIKGNRDVLAKYGIKQTRIRADNVKKFNGINDLLQSQTFKGAFKNSFDTPGVILDAVGLLANTAYEANQYESTQDKAIVGAYTATTEAVSTVASAAASAGATALATKIGFAVGTVVAPGVGTAIGLLTGFFVGLALDGLFSWIREEYIEDFVENN